MHWQARPLGPQHIAYIEEGFERIEKERNAQGLNNCGCNRNIVGEKIRCPIFKADVQRRLVYSVIAEPDTVDAQSDVMSS